MTESEKLLKTALESLENKYNNDMSKLMKQLELLQQENALIQRMYRETTEQNEQISKQLKSLVTSISRLKHL